MKKHHFFKCKYVPKCIKDKLEELQENQIASKNKITKKYIITAAKLLGMKNTDNRIFLD